MKLVKLYEAVIIEGKAQACLVNFGKELFDPQLSKDDDFEPNTETEDDYLKLIDQFTTYHHGRALRPAFIDAMKTLKGCVSSYPEVLQPDGVAYRGVNIPLRELLSQYEDISDDLNNGGIFDFIYTSPSIIQSWTTDKNAAENFAKISPFLLQYINQYKKVAGNSDELSRLASELYEHMDDISVPIVMTLNTSSDDFLFKAKYFMFLSQHEDEEELLRVNNQPTKVSGIIINPLFKPIYSMLKTLKKYETNYHNNN
jgi:hypothetical protein